MMKATLMISLLFGLLIACHRETHFITDEKLRTQVEQDFEARKNMAEGCATTLFSVFDSGLNTEEREALQFLYAYMPYSDLADYDGDFFLKQVRYAFAARDSFAWGRSIPEEIFRHFVLVYRVNNENLDTARMYVFHELKTRLQGMSMYEAALEVNHWCHEKVSYRPSDMRTSAPLATIRTGFGRCGEESTLAVTALRAVGIPARQCYTPRWAHCDDNHAWVEVWVDGKWHYLGACEPAARLDMAWFTLPATRCMMVHSNAYGKYAGNEEINHKGGLYAKINMLSNYTDTRKITISVQDSTGKPLPGAQVRFKLYNYAEYYPIAEAVTDANGQASLTTGLGDLLIWAYKEGLYNYAPMDVRKTERLTLRLTRQEGEAYVENLTMVPPAPQLREEEVTAEESARNNRRLQQEDSLRSVYTASFPTQENFKRRMKPNANLTDEQAWDIIRKSEGNYAALIRFMNNHTGKACSDAQNSVPGKKHSSSQGNEPQNGRKEGLQDESCHLLHDYLCTFSDKDLRDITTDVLEAHWMDNAWHTFFKDATPTHATADSYLVFRKGLLPARISNEMVRPYRKELSMFKGFTADSIQRWTEANIAVDDTGNYSRCPISPVGVFRLRHADPHSRDIFFVAACRAAGIPAYMDPATGQLFVYQEVEEKGNSCNKAGAWQLFSFATNKGPQTTNNGLLKLTCKGKSALQPQYYTHFTIAKFEEGDFFTFDFENDPRVAAFPVTLELEEGYYLLSTGNRYSDGTVLSRLEFFHIKQGETTEKEIIVRPLEARPDEHYGQLSQEMRVTVDGKATPITDLARKYPLVLCFIDPDREPTKHLLNELAGMQKTFNENKIPFLMVIPEEKNTQPFDPKVWHLPFDTKVEVDSTGLLGRILKQNHILFRDNYPLVFIIRPDGEITFKSEGYRIGTAALVFKSL